MTSLNIIQNDRASVAQLLVNHDFYWAHLPHDEAGKPELLHEHTDLVNTYFDKLCKVHGLHAVIDSLIYDTVKSSHAPTLVADWVKKLFIGSIAFHDFGKINEDFQFSRMKNTGRFKANLQSPFSPAHGHSWLGAYIYNCHFISQIEKDNSLSDSDLNFLIAVTLLFSYPILMHHSPYLSDAYDKVSKAEFGKFYRQMQPYLISYGYQIDREVSDFVFNQLSLFFDEFEQINKSDFALFALIKLNFSLLTASDYLSTHEYSSGQPTFNFGVLSERARVLEIVQSMRTSQLHNRYMFETFDSFVSQKDRLTERNNINLNLLRTEMAVELVREIRLNTQKRLFYIEAPTGGGKTNLSMIAATELLEANPELTKVFYVFPFTTLITQTFQALKDTLQLTEKELVELHSKAEFASKDSAKEAELDGEYGSKKKDFIDNLFALYPITVLSHVKFFDVLKTNGKETNYLLHRMANSVVIIDELQSYNPEIWDKMLFFITQYAKYFNIRFILMSATLPKISELDIKLAEDTAFTYLLPNAKAYLQNANFAKRVSFNFELFEKENIAIEELAQIVIDKSRVYTAENGSVFTIIEFIYKKSASEFYNIIDKLSHDFNEVFVLSGTILEPRRRYIINYLKDSQNRPKNILLITTQVVEAGVDIDMDLGFKNISLIDSDEQLAGRVNRNANKPACKVYLFRKDDASKLYEKDLRYKVTRDKISQGDYEQILREKDFDRLYKLVMAQIDQLNQKKMIVNFDDYRQNAVQKLNFETVNRDFKIINQQNESVYVPIAVPIEAYGKPIFSENEVKFLKLFAIEPIDGQLDGKEVWEKAYRKLIFDSASLAKKGVRFDLNQMIHFKTLQSIMSKFTFSLFAHAKVLKDLESQGFLIEKYGYKLITEQALSVPDSVYTLEQGLNENALNTTDNFFL